ncbi:MAG: protein-methionine-sulfoxide reductase heme-binding subunit MsrQ [Alphaproteobacteria bacterium]
MQSLSRHLPWNDRRGGFDPLRLAAFALVAAPGVRIGWGLASEAVAADPVEAALHRAGDWAVYLLVATLAVTPLRRLLAWPPLATVRRMLGVAAFCYAAAHLALYLIDQGGDIALAAGEIVGRFYLTVGFVALLGLGVLAATSFDAAIRRLRRNWKRLHAAVYPLAALTLVHFFLQSRADVGEPVLCAGLFAGLMLHRLPVLRRLPGGSEAAIVVVAVLAALATAAIEYAWYATMTGLPADRVLLANLDLRFRIGPMWTVLAAMAAPLPLRLLLNGLRARRRRLAEPAIGAARRNRA